MRSLEMPLKTGISAAPSAGLYGWLGMNTGVPTIILCGGRGGSDYLDPPDDAWRVTISGGFMGSSARPSTLTYPLITT